MRSWRSTRSTTPLRGRTSPSPVTSRRMRPRRSRASTSAPGVPRRRRRPRRRRSHPCSKRVVVVDQPDAVQTQFGMVGIGVPRNHADWLALSVANQMFGGSFNSRLNLRLRAKEGLTYGANSSFQSNRLAGLWGATSFTRTGGIGQRHEGHAGSDHRLPQEPGDGGGALRGDLVSLGRVRAADRNGECGRGSGADVGAARSAGRLLADLSRSRAQGQCGRGVGRRRAPCASGSTHHRRRRQRQRVRQGARSDRAGDRWCRRRSSI